jgi:Virulence factor BrkB
MAASRPCGCARTRLTRSNHGARPGPGWPVRLWCPVTGACRVLTLSSKFRHGARPRAPRRDAAAPVRHRLSRRPAALTGVLQAGRTRLCTDRIAVQGKAHAAGTGTLAETGRAGGLVVARPRADGVHNRIEPMPQQQLAPLGDQGHQITGRLVHFVDQMNVGVLGSVGLALLIYTGISLMEKIEGSFNSIWHGTQLRSLGERFSRYLSVLLVGPILMFSAVGITAMAFKPEIVQQVLAIEPVGSLVLAVGRLMPYGLVICAFTFVYMFVPNARVRFVPAFAAGIAGGILWQPAGEPSRSSSPRPRTMRRSTRASRYSCCS